MHCCEQNILSILWHWMMMFLVAILSQFFFSSLYAVLGNPQEGHVIAVQWMPHKNQACWRSRHAEWWSRGAGARRIVQQRPTDEEIHANIRTCSRGEWLNHTGQFTCSRLSWKSDYRLLAVITDDKITWKPQIRYKIKPNMSWLVP